jgi:hypothetical protein
MDRRIPFWRREIDSILLNGPTLLESIFFLFDTPASFGLTSTSTQHRPLLPEKDSRIGLYCPLSNLLLQDSFSFDYACSYSFNLYTTSVDAYSSQLPFAVSSVSSSRKHPVSQWHQYQYNIQYATSYSYLQFSVHDTWHQSFASVENVVMSAFHLSATSATNSRFQFWHYSSLAESLSRREAILKVYQLFSFDTNICHIRHNVKYNYHPCMPKHISVFRYSANGYRTSVTTSPYLINTIVAQSKTFCETPKAAMVCQYQGISLHLN